MSGSALDTAIAVIRKRGSVRTPALAEEFGIGEAAVDAMLAPARATGELTTCEVEAGGRRVIEYRCAASGGKYDRLTTAGGRRRSNGVLFVRKESTYGTAPSPSDVFKPLLLRREIRVPAAANQNAEGREEPQVTLIERAQAFFKQHGPMTAREVREHDATIAGNLKALADGATIGRLGGKTSGVIYGMPDQTLADRKAPEAKSDRPPRPIHKAAKAKKRVGGGSAAMRRKRPVKRTPRIGSVIAKAAAKKAWKTRRANAEAAVKATSFRPALAADGALLLIGAKQAVELDQGEARVLIEFIRRLDKAEVGA